MENPITAHDLKSVYTPECLHRIDPGIFRKGVHSKEEKCWTFTFILTFFFFFLYQDSPVVPISHQISEADLDAYASELVFEVAEEQAKTLVWQQAKSVRCFLKERIIQETIARFCLYLFSRKKKRVDIVTFLDWDEYRHMQRLGRFVYK